MTNPAHCVEVFEVSGAYCSLESPPTLSELAHGPLAPVGNGTSPGLQNGQLAMSVRYATGDIGSRNNNATRGRHDSGANYLCGDGHVKQLMAYQVSSGYNASTPDGIQTGTTSGNAAGTANDRHEATFSIE